MNNSTIHKTAFFNAPQETLWAFLTEADKLGLWYHPARHDLEENQDYALYDADEDDGETALIWGSVLEWQPVSKLVYTFNIFPLDGVSTTVTWQLEEAYGGTLLTLTHEGVGDINENPLNLLMALDDGWDEHLGKLRAQLKNKEHQTPSCSDH
jgi:uncharacterized protein YndB with AHSA1/START domain